MSDERDDTRPGADDPTRRQPPVDETRPQPPIDGDPAAVADPPVQRPSAGDVTQIGPGPARPDATSVMPPVDDWAPTRANPVWSGRAEVRSPQAGAPGYDTDWSSAPPATPQHRDRWWMPIVVGLVLLILLGLLGWGVYIIVQDSGDPETPGPVPTATQAPSTEPTASRRTETPRPTEPTATSPAPGPSTTEPTATEVTVPALRGLALADAQAALARTGLKSRLIYRTSDSPAGTVIDSDPAEGQEVPPDTTVTLVVARAATTPTAASTPTAPADGAADGD